VKNYDWLDIVLVVLAIVNILMTHWSNDVAAIFAIGVLSYSSLSFKRIVRLYA